MANPLQPQGTLNRLTASVLWQSFPGLNITPGFLLRDGITLTFDGVATVQLPSMTGNVTSPEPYQMAHFTAHLIKAQSFAESYKLRYETSTLMGDCAIWPDVPVGVALSPYQISNVGITNVDRLSFNGQDAGWVISFTGAYYINAQLWSV